VGGGKRGKEEGERGENPSFFKILGHKYIY
jgi:hypothetical protein